MAKKWGHTQFREAKKGEEEKWHHLKGKKRTNVKVEAKPDFGEGIQYLGFYFLYIRDSSQEEWKGLLADQ